MYVCIYIYPLYNPFYPLVLTPTISNQAVSTAVLDASEPQPLQHPRHSKAAVTRGVGQLDVHDALRHNLQRDGNLLQRLGFQKRFRQVRLRLPCFGGGHTPFPTTPVWENGGEIGTAVEVMILAMPYCNFQWGHDRFETKPWFPAFARKRTALLVFYLSYHSLDWWCFQTVRESNHAISTQISCVQSCQISSFQFWDVPPFSFRLSIVLIEKHFAGLQKRFSKSQDSARDSHPADLMHQTLEIRISAPHPQREPMKPPWYPLLLLTGTAWRSNGTAKSEHIVAPPGEQITCTTIWWTIGLRSKLFHFPIFSVSENSKLKTNIGYM